MIKSNEELYFVIYDGELQSDSSGVTSDDAKEIVEDLVDNDNDVDDITVIKGNSVTVKAGVRFDDDECENDEDC